MDRSVLNKVLAKVWEELEDLIVTLIIVFFLLCPVIVLVQVGIFITRAETAPPETCEQRLDRIEHKLDGVMPVLEHHKAQQQFIMRGEEE